MATRTEELIQSLTIEITTLKEQVKDLRTATGPLPELPIRIAVIEHKLAEMTKTKELWGQRGWMILTILLSAGFSFLAVILGGLIYLLSQWQEIADIKADRCEPTPRCSRFR